MRFPIYFYDYRICIRCGSHSVVPIDKFGRESKSMIYPITNMICKKCGQKYVIRWIKDENGKMIPVCTDQYSLHEIEKSIVKKSIENQRKI